MIRINRASFHVLLHTYASHLAMQGLRRGDCPAARSCGLVRRNAHYVHLAPRYVVETIRKSLPRLTPRRPLWWSLFELRRGPSRWETSPGLDKRPEKGGQSRARGREPLSLRPETGRDSRPTEFAEENFGQSHSRLTFGETAGTN